MTSSADPASSAPRLPLAVCMIVRDEGARLAAALASVRDVAAEIVVVDTGSADDTVVIAQAHGARVLHFAWIDDFAAARNVGLAAVSASSEWILSLDADQRLAPDAAPALAQAVRRRDCLAQVVTIAMQHAAGDDAEVSTYAALRLFRRDPRIRYSGRVHEDVTDALAAAGGGATPDSGVHLLDGGYVDPDERRRKRLRNLALLRRAHEESPRSAYVAYKLAITLSGRSEQDERRAVLARALALAHALPAHELATLTFAPRLAALAAGELVSQGRLVEAVDALRPLHAALGAPLDFAFGVALARAGAFDEAEARLESTLSGTGSGLALRDLTPALQGLGSGLALRDLTPPHMVSPSGDVMLHDDSAHPVRAALWLAWIARQRGEFDLAAGRLRDAETAAGTELAFALEVACEAVDLHISRGDVPAAIASLDVATALGQECTRVRPGNLACMVLAGVRVARASDAVEAAREIASDALSGADTDAEDDLAVISAMLEIDAGASEPARLRRMHDQILGRRYDTLAAKRLIGMNLGIEWPHPLPEATRAVLRAAGGE